MQTQVDHLVNKIRNQALGTVSAFSKAINLKDPYSANHSENVERYTLAIAEELGLLGIRFDPRP